MGKYADLALSGKEPEEKEEKKSYLDMALGEQKAPQKQEQPQGGSLIDSLPEPLKFILGPDMDTAKSIGKKGQGAFYSLEKGADEFVSGVKQSGMEKLEKIGILDEGTTAAFTKMTDEKYAKFDKEFKEEFGENFVYTMSNLVGKVGPYMMLPGGQKTAATRLAALGLGGAAVGDTTYIPEGSDASRGKNAAVGAGTAVAFGTAFEALPAVKNFIKGFFSKGANTKFAKEGQALSERIGVDLKLSQLTGHPRSEALETIARSDSAGEVAARAIESKQSTQLLRYFNKVLAKIKPDSERFGVSVKKTFDKAMGDKRAGTGMLGARAKQADKDFNAAFAASKGAKDIPLTNFNKALDELIEEVASTAERFPKGASARTYKSLAALKNGAGGKVDAREVHNLIKQYGAASKGKGKIFADEFDAGTEMGISKKLFGALKDDANASPQLVKAMNNYAKASDEILAVKDSALGKIFNVKEGSLTPDKIEDAFMKMDDSSIRQAMHALQRVDPVVKRRLQALHLERRIKGASAWGQADIPNFSPESMLKLINSEKKSFYAVFDDPTTAKQVLDGLAGAQRVMMFNNRTAGQATSVPVKLAGVLASRDKTFIARLAAELAVPSAMRDLILSKDALKALAVISKPGVSQKSALAAADTLTEWMAKEPEDKR